MELAISALAGLGKAAVGGGKALLTAATGGGAGSTALSILQGGATVASIMGTLAAGKEESHSLKMQAAESDLQAQREKTEGVRRTSRLKQTLLQVLGENDVNYAASGIDISAGVAQEARETAEKRAATEISIDRAETDARIAGYKAKSAGYRRMSKSVRRGALLRAVGTGFGYGADLMRRG